jgi:hypothetical protein
VTSEKTRQVKLSSTFEVHENAVPSVQNESIESSEETIDVNAYIYDDDGDFTNIRNSPKGAVIDKIPCGQGRYGVYLDKESNGWWHIRDSKVYDTQTDKYKDLNGNDCWIHKSIVQFTDLLSDDEFDLEFDFSDSGSADWDKVLDEYEKFVNKYVSTIEKASKGNPSALAEYAEMLEQAQRFSSKLDSAKGDMSTAQMNRLLKLENKMASVATKAAGLMNTMMDDIDDLDIDDLFNDATNSLFDDDDDDDDDWGD